MEPELCADGTLVVITDLKQNVFASPTLMESDATLKGKTYTCQDVFAAVMSN